MQTAFQVDKFAMRTGGTRAPSTGRDSALWHYLPYFNDTLVRVAHMEYSENGHAELLKAKALSGILSEDSLTLNANKVILVNREAALYSFCGKKEDGILAHCALSLGAGIEDNKKIANTLGETSKTLCIGEQRLQQFFKSL